LLEYIAKCIPTPLDGAEGQEGWYDAQVAESPTLLPSLTFFDLVFGYQTLGEGSFSTVKYARRIMTGAMQSSWPEYAVKVVDVSKLESMKYHTAVEREMATLRILGHPGVCRLVSSFQYRQSAYLVLEYCSRGDLHSLIIRRGALTALQARFAVGEIAAAVSYVHTMGFSYNDLKPENVLVTELGHIKIADFGACRAVTEEGKTGLQASWTNLANLRNGDWRDGHNAPITTNGGDGHDDKQQVWVFGGGVSGKDNYYDEDDHRVEGTPAYLPPEVLLSQSACPDPCSDAWALGCVAHFCLHGRPLFFGPRDNVASQHSYHFGPTYSRHYPHVDKIISTGAGAANTGSGGGVYVHFSDSKGSKSDEIGSQQEAFLGSLMHLEPNTRMTVVEACDHPFLTRGNDQDSDDGGGSVAMTLQPASLHSSSAPKVKLPVLKAKHQGVHSSSEKGGMDEEEDEEDRDGDGRSAEDAQWARRQFSVLWSPMPASLDDGDDDNDSGGGGGRGMMSVPSSHAPYRVVPVPEGHTELGSPFFVPAGGATATAPSAATVVSSFGDGGKGGGGGGAELMMVVTEEEEEKDWEEK
jgi:serine/threonine protein kinase